MRQLGRTIALLTMLALMALPPGACCCFAATSPSENVEQSELPPSCCRHHQSQQPVAPLPDEPCGCDAATTVAVNSQTTTPHIAPAMFVATIDVADATNSADVTRNDVSPPDTGPPPAHVLHCVWLC